MKSLVSLPLSRWMMFAGCAAFFATTPQGVAAANTPAARSAGDPPALRVCADPDYLPYSNRARQGFENKVASLVAKAMGRKLEYTWASYRVPGGFSNFLAENLDAHKCDVIMNLPTGDTEELWTKPYYRSSYVFITRKDKHLHIRSMSSVSMNAIRIGFESDTTPETAMKMLGLIDHAVGFHIADNPHASPRKLLQVVQDGKVGVMVTWEPAIGAFMKDYPDLQMRRVPSEEYGPGLPQVNYAYAMSMGVRKGDTALRNQLNAVIAAHKSEIAATLARFNVRLLPNAKSFNYSNH